MTRTAKEFIDKAERAYLPDGSGTLDLPIGTNEAIAALRIQTAWGRDVAEWMRLNSAVKYSFDQFRAEKKAREAKDGVKPLNGGAS